LLTYIVHLFDKYNNIPFLLIFSPTFSHSFFFFSFFLPVSPSSVFFPASLRSFLYFYPSILKKNSHSPLLFIKTREARKHLQFHHVLKRLVPKSVIFSRTAGGSPLAVLVGQCEAETSRTVDSR
jgi:hypothetical protein